MQQTAMAATPHSTAICARTGTNSNASLHCSARLLLTPVGQTRLQAHRHNQQAIIM